MNETIYKPSITHQRMAAIFNEWARRFAADPESFSEIIGEDGKPVEDYGESCATYFNRIAREMDDDGLLPRPVIVPKE